MNNRILYIPREANRKAKKPSKRLRWIIVIFLLGMVAASGMYAVYYPGWQIAAVSIGGMEVLGENDVRSSIDELLSGYAVFLLPKRSIILVNTDQIVQGLMERFPRIATAEVSKKFPDALSVIISERSLWGIACRTAGAESDMVSNQSDESDGDTTGVASRGQSEADEACVYIDESGFAYEEAPRTEGSLIRKIKGDGIKTVVNEYAVHSGIMREVTILAEKMNQEINVDAQAYELFSRIPGEIRIHTSGGFAVYMNRDDNFDDVFRVLKVVLEEEIGERRGEVAYIDVRFGNKVFYKER